jgi:peptide/nickel transport system ATP-binding protein
MNDNTKTLQLINLKTHIRTDEGFVRAVDGVNLSISSGEVFGLVGESGCGKTVLSLSVMKMLPNEAEIIDGKILFRGEDIINIPESGMREIRGPGMSMIFQDPLTSLNPVFSINEQLTRPIIAHRGVSGKQAREMAIQMLKKVGIPAAEKRVDEFPHQFSGGQRQRIMIAGALSLNPMLLIADEPTTALDVSIQSQILDLLRELQQEYNSAMLFISHNLAVVAGIAHRVGVMYGGWIVEEASTGELFDKPYHPYTKALLSAVPTIHGENKTLESLPGRPPTAGDNITGCRLHPRCPEKIDGVCNRKEPETLELSPGHFVRCFLFDGKSELKH